LNRTIWPSGGGGNVEGSGTTLPAIEGGGGPGGGGFVPRATAFRIVP
jgi:hypothetical protein